MAWKTIGTVSCTATSGDQSIGSVIVPAFGGIEVKVTQLSGPSPWPFSYGLLWMENAYGRELGTIKVYGCREGDFYRLGAGLSSYLGGGMLRFHPRLYNLRWLKASGEVWSLRFEYDEPSGLPSGRYRAPGIEQPDGVAWTIEAVGTAGRLRLTP